MCQMHIQECSATQDFDSAWVHLKSVLSLHLLEYYNAFELLKTICDIRSANSVMDLYINKGNFDG